MALNISGSLTILSTSGVAALAADIPINAISSTTMSSATGAPVTTDNVPRSYTQSNLSYQQPQILVNKPQQGPGLLQYPSDVGKYFFKLGVANYQRSSWNSYGTLSTQTSIILPLPEQLADASTVDYQVTPLDMLGAAAMAVSAKSQSPAAISQAISNASVTKELQAAYNSAKGIGLRTALDSSNLFGQAGAGISSGIQAGLGVAMNQYMTVMLKGPAYKTREFSWKFSPRNAQEAQTLNQILTCLKNAQAPSLPTNGAALFFSWPKIFQPLFSSYNQNLNMPGWLYSFQPCVMNDMVVNYSPSGVAFHRGQGNMGGTIDGGGAPESIQLMIRMTELNLWLQGMYLDYQGGTDIFDQAGITYGGAGVLAPDNTGAGAAFSAG